MARATRDTNLENRTQRDKLSPGKYHWRGIRPGLAIGYRKTQKGGGTWTVRLKVGADQYETKRIGIADDHQDSDNLRVIDYFEAQGKAREYADNYVKQKAGKATKPLTVADAIADYLEWYAANKKSYDRVKANCDVHILPHLGKRLVSELTTKEINKWHRDLASQPARVRSKKGKPPNTRKHFDPRARKHTANKQLTILKAALNYAWREGNTPIDTAWRAVKPFGKVDAPKIRYLSHSESQRLINGCKPDFRQMVTAALLTGCRYGELTRLKVEDINSDAGTLHIVESKSGYPRHIPLTEEGQAFFARCCISKRSDDFVFRRDDGYPWGRSHQNRPLKDACQIAHIEPAINFHVLRHTYASALALKGVPIQIIAAALGHLDTRITHRHYAHLHPDHVADKVRDNLPVLGVANG